MLIVPSWLFQRGAQSQIFDSGADSFTGIDDEQKLLEQRLLEQQRQSEEDSRWLAREEVLKIISWIN